MKILIDADVVLYLACARNTEATLEDGIKHFNGIVIDTVEAHFGGDPELYLSSNGENFRKNTYDSYKANRKGKTSPPFINELKQYAFDHLGGIESPNGEADDYLLIRAADLDEQGIRWSIATVDKDLRTYPGRFYNLRTHDFLRVPARGAYTFMVQQFVMGDPVDGIAGLRGWGQKKTEAIINNSKTLEENFYASKEIWKEAEGKGWEEGFNETFNCAYIRRRSSDLFALDAANMSYADLRTLLRIRV